MRRKHIERSGLRFAERRRRSRNRPLTSSGFDVDTRWPVVQMCNQKETDEEKELFVKKAKNENSGKESWYSVAKTKARLKDDEANVLEAEKQLKALFVSETLQNKISSLVLVLKQLYEKAPDNAVIKNKKIGCYLSN